MHVEKSPRAQSSRDSLPIRALIRTRSPPALLKAIYSGATSSPSRELLPYQRGFEVPQHHTAVHAAADHLLHIAVESYGGDRILVAFEATFQRGILQLRAWKDARFQLISCSLPRAADRSLSHLQACHLVSRNDQQQRSVTTFLRTTLLSSGCRAKGRLTDRVIEGEPYFLNRKAGAGKSYAGLAIA